MNIPQDNCSDTCVRIAVSYRAVVIVAVAAAAFCDTADLSVTSAQWSLVEVVEDTNEDPERQTLNRY